MNVLLELNGTISYRFFYFDGGKMMRVKKVINNNIVVVDLDNKEVILMGRGLGFKKKSGDSIDETRIEKRFELQDSKRTAEFSKLLNNLEIEDVQVASQILDKVAKYTNKPVSDSAIISLADHIHNVVQRARENIYIKNTLLWDIKNFYPTEYKIAEYAIKIIDQQYRIELPEDEIGFIALHIMDFQLENAIDNFYGMTKFIQDVLRIIKYSTKISIDQDSNYYYRFITHLKYLAQRIIKGTVQQENLENQQLLEVIKNQYPQAYQLSLKIKKFIEKDYQVSLSNDEIMYLTLHTNKLLTNTTKK